MCATEGILLCVHCKRRRANRPRRLCWTCYHTPGVRQMYPPSDGWMERSALPDYCGTSKPPVSPTDAAPGSLEKIAVLQERASSGLALWHPLDAPMDAESARVG